MRLVEKTTGIGGVRTQHVDFCSVQPLQHYELVSKVPSKDPMPASCWCEESGKIVFKPGTRPTGKRLLVEAMVVGVGDDDEHQGRGSVPLRIATSEL